MNFEISNRLFAIQIGFGKHTVFEGLPTCLLNSRLNSKFKLNTETLNAEKIHWILEGRAAVAREEERVGVGEVRRRRFLEGGPNRFRRRREPSGRLWTRRPPLDAARYEPSLA